MDSFELFAQLAIISFAALVHGAIGIGFPLIATPLLAMVFDVQSAVLVLVIPTICINTLSICRGGQWQKSIGKYWPLAVYGVAGSAAGTLLLVSIPPDGFRLLLAGVILLYLNAERLGLRLPWIARRPGLATLVFGLAAGFLGGTVNVMLPALVIFALEARMDKTAMIQVFNFCFLSGKLTQGAVLAMAGVMTPQAALGSLPLAGLALAVSFLGLGLRDRIPSATYRKWLRSLLLIMALVLGLQSVLA